MTPEALAELHARAFTTPRPWSAAEFAVFLAEPHTVFVTHPEGFALGRIIGAEAELLTIAIAPEHRGRGHGRALLGDWHAASQIRGAKTCFLEVAADNAPARALYRSAGYREAGRRKGYYQTSGSSAVDALILSADF